MMKGCINLEFTDRYIRQDLVEASTFMYQLMTRSQHWLEFFQKADFSPHLPPLPLMPRPPPPSTPSGFPAPLLRRWKPSWNPTSTLRIATGLNARDRKAKSPPTLPLPKAQVSPGTPVSRLLEPGLWPPCGAAQDFPWLPSPPPPDLGSVSSTPFRPAIENQVLDLLLNFRFQLHTEGSDSAAKGGRITYTRKLHFLHDGFETIPSCLNDQETVNLADQKEDFTILKHCCGFVLRKICKLRQVASQLEENWTSTSCQDKCQLDHLNRSKINETIKY